MTTALITGASGFIGGHLAETLHRRGARVRCLVRRPQACPHLRQLGVEQVADDEAPVAGFIQGVVPAIVVARGERWSVHLAVGGWAGRGR